ncbi:MAG: DUF2911 domain-containing protein [Bacteroidetes bacterium]|jgi:hypothetical protein|nr:DUF2911 domain-containing protein [Bacteroidota bacterium]
MNNIVHRFILIIASLSILISCYSEKEKTEIQSADEIQAEEINQSNSDHNHTNSEESGGNEPLSPDKMAMADIGQTHVHIEYRAPSVRDRVIWGDLVEFDTVWVSGAHMATTIQFGNALRINGQVVPAGKYAFFTIPGREGWTVILNENWDQHLADDYDQDLDVLRTDVVPVQHEFTEQLTYNVLGNIEGKGVIELMWEELKITIPVEEL